MIAGFSYNDYSNNFALLSQFIEVFNFDAASGAITSKVRNTQIGYYFNSYLSLEFSPDNRLLYKGQVASVYGLQPCGFGSGAIKQYNLCYTDTIEFTLYAPVIAQDFVWCGPGINWGRMGMGADKRIHMPYNGTMVSTINNPNRIGASVNFVFDSYNLPVPNFGFKTTPAFQHKMMAKAIINNIVYKGGCYPEPVQFNVSNDTVQTINWNFGDPSGAGNTLTQKAPSHIFSGPGIYTVTAQLYNTGNVLIETITERVEIKDPGKRLLSAYPKDTSICERSSLKMKQSVVNGIIC